MFLNENMLQQLVGLALKDSPYGLLSHMITWVQSLVILRNAKLCINSAVHRPIMNLLADARKKESCLTECLLLEYTLVEKMKEFSALLPLFFVLREKDGTRSFEFAIMEHLIEFLHLNDQHGELSRKACLSLIAIDVPDLQEYIQYRNLHVLIVAGLGGLYTSLDRSAGLESLLGFVQFIQKALETCPCTKFKDALLKEIKVAFLESVFLSSVLDASDFDGTTQTALQSLLAILQIINVPSLVHVCGHFCLDSNDPAVPEDEVNMRDLLLSKVNSASEDVCILALQALTCLLGNNFAPLTLPLLLDSVPASFIHSSDLTLPLSQQIQLASRYFDILDPLSLSDTKDTSMDAYLSDLRLQHKLQKTLKNGKPQEPKKDIAPQFVDVLEKIHKDTTLQSMLAKFDDYFNRSSRVNLAWTGLLAKLASAPCPLLFSYLYSSDLLLPLNNQAPFSIYKMLETLDDCISNRAQEFEDFDQSLARQRLDFNLIQDNRMYTEFLRNVIVLSECKKELVAIYLTHNE